MTKGGWLAIMLKKLYGARLTTPAGLMVVIQPIGRGTTSDGRRVVREIMRLAARVIIHARFPVGGVEMANGWIVRQR